MLGRTLLIVEDDARLAELLCGMLTQHGFVPSVEPHGGRAVERILRDAPDLVLLDITLPGEDGLSICRRVRASYAGPLIFLTARGDDAHVVAGLNLGADDYLVKPVSSSVLVARIHTQLRRHLSPASPALQHGALRVDLAARSCKIGENEIPLSQAELELLSLFAANSKRVLDRDFLLKRLRAQEYDAGDRSIDLRVSRLRQKLTAAGASEGIIRTVRGAGYIFGDE